MSDLTSLHDLMQMPLPSKRRQRAKKFQPTKQQVAEIYDLLNTHIFNSQLKRPSINLRNLNVWGMCIGFTAPRHFSKIKLNYRFFCIQWFIAILAHEMAHQYQWDIHGPERIAAKRNPLFSHGPTFYEFKKKMAEFGIPLRETYSDTKWFKVQDIMKM